MKPRLISLLTLSGVVSSATHAQITPEIEDICNVHNMSQLKELEFIVNTMGHH